MSSNLSLDGPTGMASEWTLRKRLRRFGISLKRAPPNLPITPNIWLKESRIAIFMDGDRWNHCPLHAKEFGGRRNANNRRNEELLLGRNIFPIRVWECELRRKAKEIAREISELHNAVIQGKTNLADLAWLAGFLDGEGTITIMCSSLGSYGGRKPYVTWQPAITVGNTQQESLERFVRTFGFGNVRHWSSTRHHLFKWTISGARRVSLVLRWLKCFLVLKRPQAELVSIGASTVGEKKVLARKRGFVLSASVVRERKLILEAIRSLNARGRGASWRQKLSDAAKKSWAVSRGIGLG